MRQQVAVSGIVTRTDGPVTEADQHYVREQIDTYTHTLSGHPAARVRLTALEHPSLTRTAVIQVSLEINGWLLTRAHVAGTSFRDACRPAQIRLHDQLTRLTHPHVPRSWPDRFGRHRPQRVPRSSRQRELRRQKSYRLVRCTVDQAALVMDVLDYDMHLFADGDSGREQLIYHAGPAGYRLAWLAGTRPQVTAIAVPLIVDGDPAPKLTSREAIGHLGATAAPFVFFRDAETGHGAVAYHRYDGHHGLLTPTA